MKSITLERFVDAQAPVIDAVRAELIAGRKRSHWMWFVFPQLRGLGRSEMARHYGLADLAEARAYWRHPLLGPRLADCVQWLLALPEGCSAHHVFGSPDDLKLRSCLGCSRPPRPTSRGSRRRSSVTSTVSATR